MKAIYNKNSELVGWYEPQKKNVFGKEMQWIGFVKNDYFFSRNARWIGALVNGVYVDKQGRPVAWTAGSIPRENKSTGGTNDTNGAVVSTDAVAAINATATVATADSIGRLVGVRVG